MAGSAALILLTLETIQSPWPGMIYIALFGLGSMRGKAILSIIIAIPSYADPVKYELDKETGAMFVDRFMSTAMHYPYGL